MHRMSDEEVVEHFRGLYGKDREEEELRTATRRMRIAAVACAVIMILITIFVIFGIVFLTEIPAHAGVVPSWSPEQTKAGDWLAIYYICALLFLGGGIGIFRFLRRID